MEHGAWSMEHGHEDAYEYAAARKSRTLLLGEPESGLWSLISNFKLQITNYKLQIANCKLQITNPN
jgi:hypothetical protein